MTKENAKDFLPLVQALADGKTIQFLSCDEWVDLDDPNFGNNIEKYRIKPEKEYVPFDTVEELIDCLNQKKFNEHPPYNIELEMPLIWVKNVDTNSKWLITSFSNNDIYLSDKYCGNDIYLSDKYCGLEYLFRAFTFLDGSPIGKIKESL